MKTPLPFLAIVATLALLGCSESSSVKGEAPGTLTLVRPGAVTVHRGGMAKAEIRLRRKDLAGEVQVRFANLPKGVDIVEPDNRIVGDEGVYTLRAGDEADLVTNHLASVTATGGPTNIAITESIEITVLAKE